MFISFNTTVNNTPYLVCSPDVYNVLKRCNGLSFLDDREVTQSCPARLRRVVPNTNEKMCFVKLSGSMNDVRRIHEMYVKHFRPNEKDQAVLCGDLRLVYDFCAEHNEIVSASTFMNYVHKIEYGLQSKAYDAKNRVNIDGLSMEVNQSFTRQAAEGVFGRHIEMQTPLLSQNEGNDPIFHHGY